MLDVCYYKRRLCRLVGFLVLPLFLQGGCHWIKNFSRMIVKKPDVKLHRLEVAHLGTKTIDLVAHVDLTNNNPFSLRFGPISHQLVSGDQEIVSGETNSDVVLLSKKTTRMKLPFQIKAKKVLTLLGLAMIAAKKPTMTWRVETTLQSDFGQVPLSFSKTTELSIP